MAQKNHLYARTKAQKRNSANTANVDLLLAMLDRLAPHDPTYQPEAGNYNCWNPSDAAGLSRICAVRPAVQGNEPDWAAMLLKMPSSPVPPKSDLPLKAGEKQIHSPTLGGYVAQIALRCPEHRT